MRKMVAVVMCTVILSGLAACGKEPEDSKSIRDILEQQQYMEVTLGESYHQEKVLFDVMGQRAVIPKDTKWGRQEFREKDVTGIFYGAQEGGERYRTNLQMTPELYRESYLKSIENLNLDAGDIKRENYVIKIVKKAQLDMFAEELIRLSNLVVKNNYRLTGVEIEFDRQCRPVRKIFRLQNREGLERGKASAECMQEFSYSVWKMKFDNAFEEVRKKIE